MFLSKGLFPREQQCWQNQSGFPWSAQEGWSTTRHSWWSWPVEAAKKQSHYSSQPIYASQCTEIPPEAESSSVKMVTGNGWTVQNLSEDHKSGERSGRVNRYLWVSTTIKVRHNIGIWKANTGQSSLSARDRQNRIIYLCVHSSQEIYLRWARFHLCWVPGTDTAPPHTTVPSDPLWAGTGQANAHCGVHAPQGLLNIHPSVPTFRKCARV